MFQVAEKELAELEATQPSPETQNEARQAEDDAEADRKAEWAAQERKFLQNIMSLQHGFSVQPLGRDRLYRRYWVFKSVPGVFVEDDDEICVPPTALVPCVQNPNGSRFDFDNPFAPPTKASVNANIISDKPSEGQQQENKDGSDKENDSLNASGLNAGSSENKADGDGLVNGDGVIVIDDEDSKPPSVNGGEECPAIKQITRPKEWKWAFFTSEEDIEVLIAALNNRGFRENALKQTLNEQKSRVLETVTKVQQDLLNIPLTEEETAERERSKVTTTEVKSRGKSVTYTAQNDSAHEGLELNLREMILDLEERIHVGSLGYLRVIEIHFYVFTLYSLPVYLQLLIVVSFFLFFSGCPQQNTSYIDH